MATGQRSFKSDGNKNAIQAGVKIEDVMEVSITAASFVAVTIPASIYPKSIYVTTRDQTNFLLSNDSGGAGYATIPSGFGIDLAPEAEEIIFYVQGTSTTTLEVILLG